MKYYLRTGFIKAKGRPLVMGAALALAALFLLPQFSFGQGNNIQLFGKISSADSQQPIADHLVKIEYKPIGTFTTPPVTKYLFTNYAGRYFLEIERPAHDLQVSVSTLDCENQILDSTFIIRHGVPTTFKYPVNLSICYFFDCSANFGYEYDTATTFPYVYQFYDNSAESVKQWRWSFGDGTKSFEQNPVHNFAEPGIYEVKLVTSTAEAFYDGCVDSAMATLSVNPNGFYNFGGQIFKDDFPIDVAEIYLYKLEEEEFIPVDTTLVDTVYSDDGIYYFYWIPEGDYLVKAAPVPGTEAYGNYFPTYFGDEVFWDDAAVIEIYSQDSSNFQKDIHLNKLSPITSGEGKVSGNISYFDEMNNPIPMHNMEVILTDSAGNNVFFDFSDESGAYQFEELSWGKYFVKPDWLGQEMDAKEFILDEQNPVIDTVDIEVFDPDTTAQGIENLSAYIGELGDPYPNPGAGHTNFKILLKQYAEFTVSIYNQLGQEVYSRKYTHSQGQHTIRLNVGQLGNGFYSIQVLTANHESYVKKLIISR